MRLSQPVAGGILAVLLALGSAGSRLPAIATTQQLRTTGAIADQSDGMHRVQADGADTGLEQANELNQQAVERYQQGQYGEAETLFLKALALYQTQSREQHPDAAISLNNLAELYRTQGRYDEAEPRFLEALAMLRAQVGEQHPLVATNLNNLAELYRLQGRYDEAEPLFLQALEIYQQQLGDRHPDVAASLNNLAGLYQSQGHYGEAESLFLQALEIYEEELGADHPLVATNLNNLALLYQNQGRYSEAEPRLLRALELYQAQPDEPRLDKASGLNNLAELYRAQGRYDEAEPLFLQSLDIYQQQLGMQHPNVATSLNNLALLYQDQGRYGEVEPLLLQSLEIYQTSLAKHHPLIAQAQNNLAELYRVQGRYDEAEPLLLQALETLREQLGEPHPLTTTSLNNLAELYREQGRLPEVEPLLRQALISLREQLGEGHPLVANGLNNLAELYRSQGRYGEAEPLFLQAVDIYREQLGERHPSVATSLNNLAQQYREQGRYGEAEPLFLEAIDIYREQVGEHHPAMAQSLNNLAGLYQYQGRYREAESLLDQALSIYRVQLGEHHPDVAISLNNLAELHRAQGSYGEAEALLEQALDIYQQQFGERHPDVATSLNNLALLHHYQGRHGEAKQLLGQALDIRREQLGDRHPLVAVSLSNLAVPYQAEGDIEAAIAHLQAGLEIQEWNLDLNLATLTDAQRQAYAATIAKTVDLTLSLHLQTAPDNPEAAELALTTLLRRKGRVLEASISNQAVLRQNLTSEDQATLDQLNAVQQALAALVFNAASTMAPAAYQTRLAELEADATQLETTLARHNTAQLSSEPVDLAAVQAQIPANGVLVEYVRYVPFDSNQPTAPWGEARYAAYLLFPEGRIEAVDLGTAAEIDAAVSAFIRDLRTGAEVVPQSEGEDAIANPLKPLIFDPIAPYLADREHLLISPDSQLNRIPFEALPTEGEDDYLVERYQISYLTSGRDLLKFATRASSTAPALIVANPTYDANGPVVQTASRSHSRSLDLSQMQVSQLPGTAAEAAAIAALLPDATILTENQATETALKTVQAPQILHIATHGFFLENGASPDPATRGLGIEWTEAPAGGGTRSGGTVENPLLRSGLALAGFNARSSGDEDGVLTALEVAYLDLAGTQLVVLSACETGLGDIANGEGVYGLRRSFAIAGAETQLMSLWRVSDEGTQALMTRYYEHLMNGQGRSEALRATQLEMIAAGGQYSHPYYWAPFILAGNWRSLE